MFSQNGEKMTRSDGAAFANRAIIAVKCQFVVNITLSTFFNVITMASKVSFNRIYSFLRNHMAIASEIVIHIDSRSQFVIKKCVVFAFDATMVEIIDDQNAIVRGEIIVFVV